MTGVLGTVYGGWLIYAAGLKYLFLAFIFLAFGAPVFILARKQSKDGKEIFARGEKIILFFILLAAVCALYAFARGLLKI